jgi:hypothetical protein
MIAFRVKVRSFVTGNAAVYRSPLVVCAALKSGMSFGCVSSYNASAARGLVVI